MKRMVILAGLLCVVFIAGCGGGGGPSSAAKKFYSAVEKGDTKAMEGVATADVMAVMEWALAMASEQITEKGKITKTTEKIDGDKAVVTLTFSNGETEDLDMVKEDGKWKVSMGK